MLGGREVVDFHAHVGRWDALGMGADAAQMLRVMDRAGIDRACIFGIFHPDGRPGNDAALALARSHPGRFIPFAYVSPLMPDHMVPELERAVDKEGCRGIKLYPPAAGAPLTDPAWDPVLEFAADRGLAVLSHTGEEATCHPAQLGEVAARYPGARFVAGHAGNVAPYRRQAIEAARACGNVYLETCSSYRAPGVIEELVQGAGADRVLFGSDMPLMDPRVQLGKIVTADLTDGEKGLILGGNAHQVLGP